jgi:predicted dehydrogenase
MNIAIVGFGYWGPNLVRNFNSVTGVNVSHICDNRPERQAHAKKLYPNADVTTGFEAILKDTSVDAVAIATPVFTHHKLAKAALNADKHVLIEKPMTSTVAEAEELIALAKQKGKVVMVDHTYLYTGAVQKIKSLVDEGTIGNIQYIDSTRINLGLFQADINVLWDLAPHDISICSHIMKGKPTAVQATGISHTKNGLENIAYLTLRYGDDKIAHFNCSWSSPVKVRHMLIGGDKKMIVFNDLEASEKIKIYDTGYSVQSDEDKEKIMVDYRVGDIHVPKIANKEALGGMASDFFDAITKGTTPLSDADLGLEVVAILEAAQISIKNGGKEVLL